MNFDVENEQYRELPLAVLRVTPANGGGAPPVSDLAIFAEDPKWAWKVSELAAVEKKTGSNLGLQK